MRWAVVAMAAISAVLVPTLAPAQQAGQLISADSVVDTPEGMQAWRITYWTTTGKSTPICATGMVVAPREAIPPRPRQVLAWTHGVWGVVQKCAPSLSPNFWRFAVTRHYARDACAVRKQVHWIDIKGEGHGTSAKDTTAATLDWIGDRFAGRKAPNDCGRF